MRREVPTRGFLRDSIGGCAHPSVRKGRTSCGTSARRHETSPAVDRLSHSTAAGDPFEALGDPNRREILRILSDGDKPVREIAAAMPISRPAVSRHLRLLKDAGMVAERAEGTRRIYYLEEEGMRSVQQYIERVWGEAAARFRLVAENTDRLRDR